MHKDNSKLDFIDQEIVYEGYFKIVKNRLRFRKFSGEWSEVIVRETFERGSSAAILLIDFDKNDLVFVEQFRVGMLGANRSPWALEIVAGVIEPGETPQAVVRREAKEEAGIEVLDLIPIYTYYVSPGGSTEQMHLFCGRISAPVDGACHGNEQEHEDIRVHVMPIEKAISLLNKGQIYNAVTIIALQWLSLNQTTLKDQFNL